MMHRLFVIDEATNVALMPALRRYIGRPRLGGTSFGSAGLAVDGLW
jgi:hypothetical protein